MRRRPVLLPWILGGNLLAATATSPAEAQDYPPPSFSTATRGPENAWELAGIVSYLTPPIHGGTSPFGVGFGGRIGTSVAGLYMGAAVVDYLGQTDVDATTHGVLYGGEIGYGFRLADIGGAALTLRPQVGVGGMTVFYTEPNGSAPTASSSSSAVRVTPNVDVVSTATARTSVRSSSGSSSSGLPSSSSPSSFTGSSSASATTTTTMSNIYFRPGVALLLSSRSTFAAVTGDVLVVPGLSYAGSTPMTWVSYGLGGQLGVRF